MALLFTSGVVHSYQLGETISVLGVSWDVFIYSVFCIEITVSEQRWS